MELRRAMGLRSVVSTSAGLVFAAIVYNTAAGMYPYLHGDSGWIVIAVAGLLLLPVWASYSELNSMYPTAAAVRLYMKRAISENASLTIALAYLLSVVLVIAADAYIIGAAISYLTGGPRWLSAVYVIPILGLAMASNLAGIKIAARVQDVATYLVIAATMAITVYGFAKGGFQLHTPFSPFVKGHPIDFVEALALAVFGYAGFEWVTASSEEVRHVKLVPRGMLITLGIVFIVLSLLTMGLTHFLTPREALVAYPQLFLAKAIFGSAGVALMVVVTAVTAVNTFNGGFVTASRFLYATAREHALPPAFAALSIRAVPYIPVLTLGIASMVLSVIVAITNAWQLLVGAGAVLEAGIYAVVCYCVITLRKRQPETPREFRMVAARALAGPSMVLFVLLGLTAGLTVNNQFNPTPLAFIAGSLIVAWFYVRTQVPKLRAQEAAKAATRTKRRPTSPEETAPA